MNRLQSTTRGVRVDRSPGGQSGPRFRCRAWIGISSIWACRHVYTFTYARFCWCAYDFAKCNTWPKTCETVLNVKNEKHPSLNRATWTCAASLSNGNRQNYAHNGGRTRGMQGIAKSQAVPEAPRPENRTSVTCLPRHNFLNYALLRNA